MDDLDYNSTFNEFEKIEQLRQKLFEELFSRHKTKVKNTPVLQDKYIYNLFETIYSTEKLTPYIIGEINEVRTDKESFKHYERSIIVSALTLSVLSWKDFDPKKLHFLIDFFTDYEKNVWERALTGIVLSSIIHQNRLQRYQIPNRLIELQKNEKTQIGIYIIDTILRNQLYKNVIFPSTFEKDEFLNETPFNWFYPFYEENPIIKEMFDKTEQDINIDDFSNFIYNIPLVSAYKYTLCNGIKDNSIILSENNTNTKSDEIIKKIMHNLKIVSNLEPFYNIISEFYLYFKFYPKDRVKEIFEHKITLAQTKLKNIILSKVQELKLSADLLFEKKEYHSCILKLKELLNIEPNQLSALIQISDCYLAKDEFSDALIYLYELDKVKPNNFTIQYRIGYCLNNTKQYKKSIEYLFKANQIKTNEIIVLYLIGNNYKELRNYEKSIEFHEKALLIEENYELSLLDINYCYYRIDKPEVALKYSQKLYDIKPEDPEYLIHHATNYSEMGEFEKALEFASKAFLIDSNDCYITFNYARISFIIGDYNNATILFKKCYNMKNSKEYHGIIWGNLGHIALFDNDIKTSKEIYQKCVLEFDDINEFIEKFDSDLKYALKNNIPKSKYEEIKQEMIKYWQENK